MFKKTISLLSKDFFIPYEQPKSTLIKDCTVVTLGEENKVLTDHSVIIRNGIIEKIQESSKIQQKDSEFDKVICGEGNVVLPGWINAHMHYYSSFARGLSTKPSSNFIEVLENLWWKLDKLLSPEDNYYSTLIACIQAIKYGTTTLIDHHASPFSVPGSLDLVADCILDTGLRGSLCYELSDRDGKQIRDEGIEENARFIERCNNENNDRLKALFGLHASFTVSDESLERSSEIVRDLDSGFHVHTAEGLEDKLISREKWGESIVERFRDHGILGPKTICAHCIHLEEGDMEILKETDSIVVTCPQSNMNNAVGVLDIVKLQEMGVLVGLGTDAMTTNMLEELRSAMWIQKLNQQDPGSSFMEVTNTLAQNNRKICERYWGDIGIGELKEGGVADLNIIEYFSPTTFDANTFLGHMVFGIPHSNVHTTICGGNILMENGKLTTIDEQKAMEKTLQVSKMFWRKFNM